MLRLSQPYTQPVEADGSDDSHELVSMRPAPNNLAFKLKQRTAFSDAFHATLLGHVEGGLTTFLFYDLDPSSDVFMHGLNYDAKTILSGARAWDRRSTEDATKPRSFIGDDSNLLKLALSQDLLSVLPRNIHLISYGGGDQQAFSANEGQLITAIQSDLSKSILSQTNVDVLHRYVDTNCYIASRVYQLHSLGVQGDAINNGRLAITKIPGATPVVGIFGGTLENASVDPRLPDPRAQAEMNMAAVWAKMNIQHGLGSFVVKTFDRDKNPLHQNAKYSPTKPFEAFELSYLARAVEQGDILNPDYDVFEHWRLASDFSTAASAQKMSSVCKKDHILHTPRGDYPIHAGQSLSVTLSHKFDEMAHIERIMKPAGYEVRLLVEQPGNGNVLVVAEAVRDPLPELARLIPFTRSL